MADQPSIVFSEWFPRDESKQFKFETKEAMPTKDGQPGRLQLLLKPSTPDNDSEPKNRRD